MLKLKIETHTYVAVRLCQAEEICRHNDTGAAARADSAKAAHTLKERPKSLAEGGRATSVACAKMAVRKLPMY